MSRDLSKDASKFKKILSVLEHYEDDKERHPEASTTEHVAAVAAQTLTETAIKVAVLRGMKSTAGSNAFPGAVKFVSKEAVKPFASEIGEKANEAVHDLFGAEKRRQAVEQAQAAEWQAGYQQKESVDHLQEALAASDRAATVRDTIVHLSDFQERVNVPLPSKLLSIHFTDSSKEVCEKIDAYFEDIIRDYPVETQQFLREMYVDKENKYIYSSKKSIEKGDFARFNLTKNERTGSLSYQMEIDPRLRACPITFRLNKIHEIAIHAGQHHQRIGQVGLDTFVRELEAFNKFTEQSVLLSEKILYDALPEEVIARDLDNICEMPGFEIVENEHLVRKEENIDDYVHLQNRYDYLNFTPSDHEAFLRNKQVSAFLDTTAQQFYPDGSCKVGSTAPYRKALEETVRSFQKLPVPAYGSASKAEVGHDSVSRYETLLGETMRETQKFYGSARPVGSEHQSKKPAAKKQAEEQRQKKEALARAREIDLKKIRLSNAVTKDENLKGLEENARQAHEKYVTSVREKQSKEIQAALGREFIQSTAAFGDAISKNLSSAGYRTAGRVLSSVSNGLSASLSAHAMGAALKGLGMKTLGAAAGPIGIAIAAFTTIMALCGDDDSSQQSNGLSELAAHMDSRFDRVESLIQKSTDAIRSDIRVLHQLMIQVFAEVQQLSTICLETLQCLYELNHFVREEAVVTAAQLKSIETHPLKFSQFMLEQYLTGEGKQPDQASFDMMKFWLVQNLHEPVINKTNCAFMSFERVASMLEKQAEKNIVMPGFLALLLHQFFPHLNFNAFATLPPMPLFPDLSELYLNALEKAGKTDREDYVSVCEKTKATIKLYLQFIGTLKKHPEVTQALFDQYAYYQRKNDKQHFTLMAKIKGLLQNLVPLLENKKFEEKLVLLNEKAVMITPVDIWDQLPKKLLPTERVKKLFDFLNQDKVPTVATSNYIILPEAAPYSEIPAKITWAPYGSPDNETTSEWGSKYFPQKPKPAAFSNNSLLLLCLASGYADVNYFRNTTLKSHVAELIAKCPSNTYGITTGGSYQAVRFSDIGVVRIEGSPYGDRCDGTIYIRYKGEEHLVYKTMLTWDSDAKTHYPFKSDASIYSGHRANIFQYYAELPNAAIPLDYTAISNSFRNGVLKNMPNAFKYAVFIAQGNFVGAEAFAEKNPVDHTCLLFLVSIIDRFDIFESYIVKNKLPLFFNFLTSIENTKITPTSIAQELGHVDVVSGIDALVNETVIAEIETSEEKRLNAQLLTIAGYEAEFLYMATHQEPVVDAAKEAHESEEIGYQRGLEIGNAMALIVIAAGLQQAGFAKAADILLADQTNPLEMMTIDSLSSAENKGFLQAVSAKVVKASACLLRAREIDAVTWLTEFSDVQIEKSLQAHKATNALLGDADESSSDSEEPSESQRLVADICTHFDNDLGRLIRENIATPKAAISEFPLEMQGKIKAWRDARGKGWAPNADIKWHQFSHLMDTDDLSKCTPQMRDRIIQERSNWQSVMQFASQLEYAWERFSNNPEDDFKTVAPKLIDGMHAMRRVLSMLSKPALSQFMIGLSNNVKSYEDKHYYIFYYMECFRSRFQLQLIYAMNTHNITQFLIGDEEVQVVKKQPKLDDETYWGILQDLFLNHYSWNTLRDCAVYTLFFSINAMSKPILEWLTAYFNPVRCAEASPKMLYDAVQNFLVFYHKWLSLKRQYPNLELIAPPKTPIDFVSNPDYFDKNMWVGKHRKEHESLTGRVGLFPAVESQRNSSLFVGPAPSLF